MKLFDAILQQGETEQEAVAYASGMCWGEVEVTEQRRPRHSRYVTGVNGVGVWYDYAADYYFFEDEESEV